MDVDVSAAAGLLGDRTRAAVVAGLSGGKALTAGELARYAGVSAPTMSSHLKRLESGHVVAVEKQGRHRYYRLADPKWATVFEALAAVSNVRPVRSLIQSRVAQDLRYARMCYDHLAGTLAVRLVDRLIDERMVVRRDDTFHVTAKGQKRFDSMGVDVEAVRRSRRAFARPCLDWSERRVHLAGALGAGLADRMIDLGWINRSRRSRGVGLTEAGQNGLAATFGLTL